MAMEKPKLDSARMLRSVCVIDPKDIEFKETMKMQAKVGFPHGISHMLCKV